VTVTDSGFIRFRIGCPETERDGCTGVLKVYVPRERTLRAGSSRMRQIKLGEQAYGIQPGRVAVVKVPISRRYLRYVQRRRSMVATAVVFIRADEGRVTRAATRFRLRAPGRRGRR
jgi:hypothetical protein